MRLSMLNMTRTPGICQGVRRGPAAVGATGEAMLISAPLRTEIVTVST